MKKILGVISWLVAILGGVGLVVHSTQYMNTTNENDVLFFSSLIVLILGVVGIVVFAKETKKFIFNLFENLG